MTTSDNWHLETFGTHSLVTERDAVCDAYVVTLEAALRKIASGVEPGFGTLSGTTCAEIAREALGLGEVERIPDGVKWPHDSVAFTRYPNADGDWHLIGPSAMLEPGTVIEVQRFSEREPALVAVGRVVAKRSVIHRKRGTVQYVVTRVSRATREE